MMSILKKTKFGFQLLGLVALAVGYVASIGCKSGNQSSVDKTSKVYKTKCGEQMRRCSDGSEGLAVESEACPNLVAWGVADSVTSEANNPGSCKKDCKLVCPGETGYPGSADRAKEGSPSGGSKDTNTSATTATGDGARAGQ